MYSPRNDLHIIKSFPTVQDTLLVFTLKEACCVIALINRIKSSIVTPMTCGIHPDTQSVLQSVGYTK